MERKCYFQSYIKAVPNWAQTYLKGFWQVVVLGLNDGSLTKSHPATIFQLNGYTTEKIEVDTRYGRKTETRNMRHSIVTHPAVAVIVQLPTEYPATTIKVIQRIKAYIWLYKP